MIWKRTNWWWYT